MKQMSAGQVFKSHYDASLKHTKFNKGHELIDFDKPNLLFYVPTLFTQVNTYLEDRQYTPNVDISQTVSEAMTYIKAGKKLPKRIIVNLGYNAEPVSSIPQMFSMDITSRFFYDKAKLLVESATTGYEFKHSVPNFSYATTCMKDGRTKWDGVTIAFPTLKTSKTYYLEVVETYHLNVDEFLEDSNIPKTRTDFLKYGDFTRKVIFPLQVDTRHTINAHQAKWNCDQNKQLQTAFCASMRSDIDPRILEPISHKYGENTDLSAIGQQSVLMGLNNVSRIIFDPTIGVFCDYNGSQSDFIENVKLDLHEHNLEPMPELLTLLKNFTTNQSSLSYVAAMMGTHCRYGLKSEVRKCLDHNGLGGEIIDFKALLFNPKMQRLHRYLSTTSIKRHHSYYDFEEVEPSFILPNVEQLV